MKRFSSLILSISMLWLCLNCIGLKPVETPQPKPVLYTVEFEGLTQLILASETDHAAFTEVVRKEIFWNLIPLSQAQIQVNANVTYDFYVDFGAEGYHAEMNRASETLTFKAPAIRMKKPVFNNATVSFPEKGILINEDREAIRILENLTDRFIEYGKPLLNEDRVRNTCHDQLEAFLRGLCQNMDITVTNIVISFADPGDTLYIPEENPELGPEISSDPER